jgi:ABC-2 type transport system ATP-binding protein
MIILENVCKEFKKEPVIKNVSATFPSGQITGIIGRNGCGKTVLFKMICGLMIPTSGTITVNDEVVGKDVDFPSSIGTIIETPGFIGTKSGIETLLELAAIRRKIGKEEVIRTLQRVGLDPDSNKRTAKYSLGMRQRLGIAQAIMENPDTLVLDEPMNGLDKHGVSEMRDLFYELKEQGKTILIASHNKDDIDILCDEVYEMDAGVLSKGA